MKHYAHIYLMLAALALSGCRTATHSHRTVDREVDDSLSQVKESSARTIITQSVTTRVSDQTYDYRITRTFDTTQPVDSNTHLPPTRSIVVEGKKRTQTVQASTQTDVARTDTTHEACTISHQEVGRGEEEVREVPGRTGGSSILSDLKVISVVVLIVLFIVYIIKPNAR